MSLATKHKGVIDQVISIFFVLFFTYAAVMKLQQFKAFQTQLEQFPFIGGFAEWVAWVVPGILIIITFLFFFERSRLVGLYGVILLVFMFSLYIIAVLNFAESIPCSCAGVFTSLSWTEHLILNIGSILLALLGIFLSYDLRLKNQESPGHKLKIKL